MLNFCIHPLANIPVELIVKPLLEHHYPLTKLGFLLLLGLDLSFFRIKGSSVLETGEGAVAQVRD